MQEIVGRDAELGAIEHWLDGAGPSVLLLEGDAGMGKTTLWRAGVESASSRGVCVLVAAASAETAAAATSLSLTSGSDITVLSGEDLNTSVGRDGVTTIGRDALTTVGDDLQVDVASNLNVQSGGSGIFQLGGSAVVQSSGGLSLTGSTVNVNGGSSCAPAARQGDSVNLTTGSIVSGSGTVCIGWPRTC